MFRIHVVVTGRVQGVFFRDFTRTKAKALDVKGWVRNLFDGRVEIMGEGDKTSLETFLDRVKIGPTHADVQTVDVSWTLYRGDFKEFEVKQTGGLNID